MFRHRFPPIVMTCQNRGCGTQFTFTPSTSYQARNPSAVRPVCHACHQERLRRDEIARRTLENERVMRESRERAERDERLRAEREETERVERERMALRVHSLRDEFSGDNTAFFERIARLSDHVNELVIETEILRSDRVRMQNVIDDLTSRLERIETVMRAQSHAFAPPERERHDSTGSY